MKPFVEIIEDIKEIEGIKNDNQVAAILGATYPTFKSWKHRNSTPYEVLLLYCQSKGINFHWLLTNDGSMYIDETEKDKIINRLTKENSDIKAVRYKISEEDRTSLLGIAERLIKE